jgi:hypothetical protein
MTLGPLHPKKGPADYSFEDGWGVQGFPSRPDNVHAATRAGMADLKMHTIHDSRGEGSALILDGQAHDGRHVRVVVRPGEIGSIVTARVGRFGDEALARSLLERIGVRLGTLPPAPIPDEPPTSPRRSLFSRFAVPDAQMLREQANAGYRDSETPLSPGP